MRTIYLHYQVNGQPVVLGFDQAGTLVCLHRNGVDCTEDGQVMYEVMQALEERGVDVAEAISVEFERASMRQQKKSAAVS